MSLLRSSAVVSSMTLISRIMGFIRDVLIARLLGAGLSADVFFVAFKIPNMLRRLFAEGAFAQAFVPVLGEYKIRGDEREVQDLVDATFTSLALVLLVITVLGVLAAPLIIMVFAPGFIGDAHKYSLAVTLLRITFPYALFISLTAFCGALLNTYRRFAIPAFTPVLLNLSLICATLWLAPRLDEPTVALAIGVSVAGVVQLAFQIPALIAIAHLPRLRFSRVSGCAHEGVRRILKLMGPALFGVSVAQINMLFDTLLASLLVTGSISWLYYADRLVEFPLGVFGIALSTVILPHLSAEHAIGSPQRFSATLDWALRLTFVVGLAAATGLAVLAEPILCTLFNYGAMTAYDVTMAGRSLSAYALGLIGFILVKVLAPGFFARQDTKTPVKVGIVALLCNMVLNLVFILPLAHAGLALATALSSFINAGLLLRLLRRDGVYQPRRGWFRIIMIGIGAALAMILVLWWCAGDLEIWLVRGALARGAHLAGVIVLGAATYGCMLFALGLRRRDLSMSAMLG